jgi:hypothetical protein
MENMKGGRENLVDIGVSGRIILKQIYVNKKGIYLYISHDF